MGLRRPKWGWGTFWGLRNGAELWGISEVWEGPGTGIPAGDIPGHSQFLAVASSFPWWPLSHLAGTWLEVTGTDS